MKAFSWTLGAVAAASGLMVAQGGAFPVLFDFGSTTPTTSYTSGTPFSSTVSAISLVNAFGTIATNPDVTSPSSGYANASGGFNYDLTTPNAASLNLNTSAYYKFTVTPDAGNIVQILDFDFGGMSATVGGPLNYVLRWSGDNYAANITSGTFTRNSTWVLKNGSFTAKTSTTNGAAQEFRLYFYNTSTAVSGTPNISIDDVRVSLAVPEASDCALYACAGIVGLTWMGRRWRSQKPKA